MRFRRKNGFCILSSLATGMGVAGNPKVVLPNYSTASPATHVAKVLEDVRSHMLGLGLQYTNPHRTYHFCNAFRYSGGATHNADCFGC